MRRIASRYSDDRDQRDDRQRRRQRLVVGGDQLAVDDVAEHLGLAADDRHRDVVAERQREGEDRAGRDAGEHQRRDHHAQRRDSRRRPGRSWRRSSESGTRSNAANTGMTMYGNHRYVSVMTVAVSP